MERFRRIALLLLLPGLLLLAAGCEEEEENGPVGPGDETRGEPLDGGTLTGSLSGVYTISDTVTVPSGQTLTLQPGTELYFRPNAALNVRGEIQAVGTVDNWITFQSVRSNPERGDWDGVRLLDASDNSTFEYVRIAHAAQYDLRLDTTRVYFQRNEVDRAVPAFQVYRGALTIKNCSPTVRRSIIELGGYDGIHIIGNAQPRIEHNTIVQNAFNAIHIEPDWSLVDTSAADPLGQVYENVAPATIVNNILVENDDAGIRLYEDQQLYAAGMIPEIAYNNIWNNASLNYVPPSFRDMADVSLDIHLNPVFEDIDDSNYALHPCSYVIDRADPTETDPDGTRADVGAIPLYQGPYDLAKRLVNDNVYNKLNLEAGEVYRVRCDTWVEEGDVLTIPAGTILAFEGPYSLYIRGGIEVSGTQGDEVVFTSALENPSVGDWRQLVLDEADDASFFEHAIIEYASLENRSDPAPDTLGALTVIASSPQISNLTVRNVYYAGVHCFNGSNPVFDRLEVMNAGYHGVISELNSSPTLTRTRIHDVKGYGMQLLNNSNPEITNLLMYNLGGSGFFISELSSPEINYATVYGRRMAIIGSEDPVARHISHGLHAKSFASPLVMNSILAMYGDSGVLSEVSSRPDIRYTYLFTDAEGARVEGPADETSVYSEALQFQNAEEFNFRLPASSPGKTASEDGGEVGAYGGNGM